MGKKQKQLSAEEQRERAQARRIANGVADGKLQTETQTFNGTCNKCGKTGHRAADCKGGVHKVDDPCGINFTSKTSKGHKQRGAGAVLTSKGPVETRSGVLKKDWQRLPTQLLHEYCQREKRPKPIYHSPKAVASKNILNHHDDEEEEEEWKKYERKNQNKEISTESATLSVAGYKQRIVLPDSKHKERSLTFAPEQPSPTKELAREHTALLALLHVCGDLPLERKLPDEFREVWIASSSCATTDKKTGIKKTGYKDQTPKENESKQTTQVQENKVQPGNVPCEVSESSSASTLSLTADSKFASKADRRLHEMEKTKLKLAKQRKRDAYEKANADASVMMSNKMRLMIEVALGLKLMTPCPPQESQNSVNNVNESNPEDVKPYGFLNLDVAHVTRELDHQLILPDLELLSSLSASVYFILNHKLLRFSYMMANSSTVDLESSFHFQFSSEEYFDSLESEFMVIESMYAECFSRIEVNRFGTIISVAIQDCPIIDVYLPALSSSNKVIVGNDKSLPSFPPAFLVRGVSFAQQVVIAAKYVELLELFTATSMAEPPTVLVEMISFITDKDYLSSSFNQNLYGAAPLTTPLIPPPVVAAVSKEKLRGTERIAAADDHTSVLKQGRPQKHQSKGFWDVSSEFNKTNLATVPPYIALGRQKLPAASTKQDILSVLRHHQVILIAGGTGCGKTTQVPQFILEDAVASVKVVVAQPRRIAAIGVATRVHEEMGEQHSNISIGSPGSKVGYMVRGDSKVNAHSCSLLFCTTGVLLQRLKTDHNLNQITHLIVDEVHERHVDSDFLLAALKRILINRPTLKLIMMSATIDTNKFSDYFAQSGKGCPIITIPGFAHPVTSFYLEDVSELTGMLPRNLAISKAKTTDQSGIIDDGNSGGGKSEFEPRNENGKVEDEKEALENWEDFDDEEDLFKDDVEEETNYDFPKELENSSKVNLPSASFASSKSNRFGEVAKSKKQGSEIGGQIDALVSCDCKLIKSLIHKVIARGMHKGGSFLVFLPGVGEISKLCDVLNAKERRSEDSSDEPRKYSETSKLLVLPLHGGLSARDQLEVFKTPKRAVKVVVATNIAETSITIPDCTVVIDSARVKQTGFDASNRSSFLAADWAAQDALKQRQGRAGRVAAGICFKLVPRKLFDWLPCHTVPEISRIPLEELVLLVKANGYGNPQMFLSTFLDPPPVNAIQSAISSLKDLNALAPPRITSSHVKNGKGLELTPLGKHLCQLPCSASIGKMLVMGALLNVLKPVLNIAAALSVRSPLNSLQHRNKKFKQSKNEEEDEEYLDKKVDESKNRLNLQTVSKCGRSDLCFIAAVVDCWLSCGEGGGSRSGERKDVCEGLGLSYVKMVEIEQLRHQYKEALASLGFHVHEFNQQINADGTSSALSVPPTSLQPLGFKSVSCIRRSLNEWRVISAVLLSSLWPNIVRIRKPIQKYHDTVQGALETEADVKELKFEIQRYSSSVEDSPSLNIQKDGSGGGGGGGGGGGSEKRYIQMLTTELVAIHPSSLLSKENKYTSQWLVFSECITTSRRFLCNVSECSPYAILLFGGGKLAIDSSTSSIQSSIAIETPLYQKVSGNKLFNDTEYSLLYQSEILKWCQFQAPLDVATLVDQLRSKMNELLEAKISNPELPIHEDKAMAAMVRLLITEGLG